MEVEEEQDARRPSLALPLPCETKTEMEEGARKREREGEGEEASATKKQLDPLTQWRMRVEQEEESEEEEEDMEVAYAHLFRRNWEFIWSDVFGSFEDRTPISPRRFTDRDDPYAFGCTEETLQIFSVKIAQLRGDLQWPLHVYGMVAARDCIDRMRNIIFDRDRNNCQTLTQESPYLDLRGPTRAIVTVDPVVFEVILKVKGNAESDDKDLSFLAAQYRSNSRRESCLVNRAHTSKLSTVELTFGHIVSSVEATIDLHVIDGSSPDGFRGKFTACTASIDKEVVLLDSGDDQVPVAANGMIKLSRNVVSVELKGELKVQVAIENNAKVVAVENRVFMPKIGGRSNVTLSVGFCEMRVTVAWSLLSLTPLRIMKSEKT